MLVLLWFAELSIGLSVREFVSLFVAARLLSSSLLGSSKKRLQPPSSSSQLYSCSPKLLLFSPSLFGAALTHTERKQVLLLVAGKKEALLAKEVAKFKPVPPARLKSRQAA